MSEALQDVAFALEGPGGFPLSPQQRRLWALHRADPAAPWQTRCSLSIEGDLDPARLRTALLAVVARFEVLRTRFRCPPGMKEPLQAIGEPELAWEWVPDVAGPGEGGAWGERIWTAEAGAWADPESGPVLGAWLAAAGPRRHLLVLRLPALCADVRSMSQLAGELARAYEAGGELADEEPLQYADLAAWQNELLDDADAEEGRAFWRRLDLGSSLSFALPFGRSGGHRTGFAPRAVELPLSPDLAAALARRAEELDVPLPSLLLAGWLALLRRLVGGAEVTVGTAFDGRSYQELAEAIGPLARYLPVQATAAEADPTFERFAAQVGQRMREVYDRQEFFSWEDLPGVDAVAGYTACFDYTELPPRLAAGEVAFTPERLATCAERGALRLSWVRREGGLAGEIWYDASTVERAEALRTAAQLTALLDGAAAAPETPLARLPLLSPAERRRLVAELNDTARPLDETPIHHLFEAWVERTPAAPALVFEDERLSFAELDLRANRLAHRLCDLGVGPEVPVALLLPRSHRTVVVLLAVLKSGGCYVPVDPGLPAERAALMIAEAGAPVIVCESDPPPGLAGPGVRLLRLDVEADVDADAGPMLRPAVEVPPESAAYVLFTSGSTGRPKGVVVEHRQLASYLAAIVERLDLPSGASYATVSTFAADLGNTALFPALATGGCLHVISQERLADPEAMAQYFERHAIDCLKIVPSHLEALHSMARPERTMPRRRLVVGGEAPRRDGLARVQALAPECRILNHYGPTEATVGVLTHVFEPASDEAAVPLGRPLANARVYTLDSQLDPVPTWLAGEIAIGGASVARGYLGRPDLTAERFLPDPWGDRAGSRLYRTGDLARRRPDGLLEFLGRADDQVKIRGFRVEPGEIEAVLREHPAVRAATVLAREDRPGQRRLVGYVAAVAGSEVAAAELTAYLAERLPDFMVPAALVVLPKLPLNANGKVDRQRLPEPEAAVVTARAVAPRTALETTLAEIWTEVLGVESVGVEDSFFRLGGDSIRSISVRGKALERGLDFSVAELFEHPTVAGLARLLEERDGATAAAPLRTAPFSLIAASDRARLPADVEDAYPLTRLQAGMVFHSELSQGTAIYHDVHSFHLRLRLELPLLARAAAELAARHPVLRTSFDLSSYGETLQLVHRHVAAPLTHIDLRGLTAARQEEEIAAWLADERRRAFDWSRPPLIRLFVHRRGDDSLQFTLSFHHAIVDGWSTASLTAELFTRYLELLEGERPPAPPFEITFRDFVALERQALAAAEQREFWQRLLTGRNATRLPRWSAAAAAAEGEAQVAPVALPSGVGEGLKRLAEAVDVPVKSVFLAAHMKALSVLLGERDVVTGLISNGRPEEADGDRVLGLFLNTVPFRLELAPGRWIDLVRAAFRAEQELTPHRRFPIAELQRREGGEPLFETAFNYVHYHVYQGLIGTPEIQVVGQTGYEETNFTLEANFALGLTDGSVLFWLSYRTSDLSAGEVEAIASRYVAVLSAMALAPDAEHGESSPLAVAERHQLLVEWNDSARDWPAEPSSWELIAAQARRAPEAVAVVAETAQLTYGELARRIEGAAGQLAAGHGVGPGTLVAVLAERGLDFWLAALAVVAAGGA